MKSVSRLLLGIIRWIVIILILLFSIATIYPFQFVRDQVTRWAIGTDPYVLEKYGDWFNCIMKGTVPLVAHPIQLSTAQKSRFEVPILLFLGTKDQIVGHADYVNKVVEEFLGL